MAVAVGPGTAGMVNEDGEEDADGNADEDCAHSSKKRAYAVCSRCKRVMTSADASVKA